MTLTHKTKEMIKKILSLKHLKDLPEDKLIEVAIELIYDKYYEQPDLI